MTYKKGEKPPIHKPNCKCFRCTGISWNKGKKCKSSHRKGVTLEQEYGIEKANEIKRKMRLYVVSDETKEKIRQANFNRSPETLEKIRLARSKQVFPVRDSSIEVKIQEYLKLLGVDFFTHQYMKIKHGYLCDFFIPSLNLIIETDGDYWHKYPVGRDIDKVRTKELIEKGFKVLRLWENEIVKMDLQELKEKINRYGT